MNFDLLTLAATSDASAQKAGPLGLLASLLPMIIIFAAMYFIMIRPNKKRQKEEKKMRENLQVGDEIVTIGGIHGRVVSLKEDTMIIESQVDRSKMTIARWALQSNLTVHDEPAAK